MTQLDKMENNNYTIQIDRSIVHDYYEQARKNSSCYLIDLKI